MLSAEFLAMLCCPEDRTPLVPADAATVARLNEAAAAGRLKNRSGQPVTKQLDGVLIRTDKQIAYPIIDDIPILLIDEGIRLNDA